MTDLHTTLTAKVTAHLELAQAATPGPWELGIVYGTLIEANQRSTLGYLRGIADAEHVVANDPDHVIRVCRADLERLEEHQRARAGTCTAGCLGGDIMDVDYDGEEETVSWTRVQIAWPCPEIRRIAAVYGVDLSAEVDG